MLHLIDESLEAFLRTEVPLPEDVSVSFDAPDRDWAAHVSARTLDLFLYDVRRNLREHQVGWEPVRDEQGRPGRRRPPLRIDSSYAITLWATGPGEEHQLLGDVLAALLVHRTLPTAYLRRELSEAGAPPALAVLDVDAPDGTEFWPALGGRLRPALHVVVTTNVPSPRARPGAAVERVSTTVAGRDGVGGRSLRRRVAGRGGPARAGDLVWSRRGSARVHADGSFQLVAEQGDQVVSETPERARTSVQVPETGHVVLPDPEPGRSG